MKLPRLHKKGQQFYHVTGTSPRRWTALGPNFTRAVEKYQQLEAGKSPRTLKGIIAAFMADEHPEWSPGTRAQYKAYAGHLTRVLGDFAPDELERLDVLDYIDRCKRSSVMTEISLLRQVYERAVRRKEALSNPCVGVKPLKPRRSKRERLVTDAEFARIRAKASPVLQVAMDLAYLTALRPSDLCRLRWGDLENGIKTAKTGVWLRFTMAEDLRTTLTAAKALGGRVRPLTVLSEDGLAITAVRLGDLWRIARKAAGIPDAQFRDLRAKSASDDPEQAQDRLGHTTPQMTRTYLRGRQVKEVAPTRRRKGA